MSVLCYCVSAQCVTCRSENRINMVALILFVAEVLKLERCVCVCVWGGTLAYLVLIIVVPVVILLDVVGNSSQLPERSLLMTSWSLCESKFGNFGEFQWPNLQLRVHTRAWNNSHLRALCTSLHWANNMTPVLVIHIQTMHNVYWRVGVVEYNDNAQGGIVLAVLRRCSVQRRPLWFITTDVLVATTQE